MRFYGMALVTGALALAACGGGDTATTDTAAIDTAAGTPAAGAPAGDVAAAAPTGTIHTVNMVLENGALELGTVAQPMQADATSVIEIVDRPFLDVDPEQLGNGIVVLGRLSAHGAVKTPTFLRLAKNALQAHTEDLGSSWPRLRTQLLPLCGSDDQWAVRLNGECLKLDTAVSAGDLGSQRSAFMQVHSQAATRFYQVDLSLQRLCESLREIGTPLTELLRRLQ